MKVLVVDDNAELLDLVGRSLTRDHHDVAFATSRAQADEIMNKTGIELIVLDLALPDGSGIELCRALRARGNSLPVLVLTAQTNVSSRVTCLDLGADDYLGKPFAVAELRARVRALARRAGNAASKVWTHPNGELDFVARQAKVNGRSAPLTAREWAILERLVNAEGAVVSRDDLLTATWHRVDDSARASLDVLVSRIRRKLWSSLVRTVRGEGYCLGRDQ